jgi:hypothetical protein
LCNIHDDEQKRTAGVLHIDDCESDARADPVSTGVLLVLCERLESGAEALALRGRRCSSILGVLVGGRLGQQMTRLSVLALDVLE